METTPNTVFYDGRIEYKNKRGENNSIVWTAEVLKSFPPRLMQLKILDGSKIYTFTHHQFYHNFYNKSYEPIFVPKHIRGVYRMLLAIYK